MALVWDSFARAAEAMARLQQVSDLPIVVVPRVQLGETDADQRAKGTKVAEEIVSAWAAGS